MDDDERTMIRAQVAGAYTRIATVAALLPLARVPVRCLSAGGDAASPSIHVRRDVLLRLADREGLDIIHSRTPDGRTRSHVLYLGVECWDLA